MINDSPLAASTFGVSLTLTKLMTFALCAAAAAFAGALFGAARLTVSPGDFSFNASLELLLLVVLGGRSLVAGALMAGAVFGAQLFPIPTSVEQYIPLGVAVGVIGIANNPEGPIVLTVKIVQKFLALFQPLPRDDGEEVGVTEARTPPVATPQPGMQQTPIEAHA
jgi:ABC-type glucose/galactose transport system permease subunit